MYARAVKSGKNTYLRLVEGYRDKQTGKVRQRTISNLCRIDADSKEKIRILMKWAGLDSDSEEQLELFDLLEVDRPKNIVKGG